MAKTEYYAKRVESKEKEIAKLTAKMARIEKAESTNWEVNPYYYSESDKRRTARDLEIATAALADLKAKYAAEMEKDNSRNIPAILEFLEDWKNRVYNHYVECYPVFMKEYEAYSDNMKERREAYYRASRIERNEMWYAMDDAKREFRKTWGWMMDYTLGGGLDTERLKKDLEEDAKAKYDDIVERTNKIVGEITDAAGLSVGAKGELNGYIVGTRGKAKVNTIGAGGYNIQIFHFRTLIHKVK